ncbi:MAG: hypothetical protein K8R74_08230 [Bacteroidales bacterium]|nr:hypothetical protein [Bacteroidales bacterium]
MIDEKSELPVILQKEKTIILSGAFNPKFYYSTNRCWIHLNAKITRNALAKEISFNTKTPIIFHLDDQTSLSLFPSTEYYSTKSFLAAGVLIAPVIGVLLSSQTDDICYSISKEDVEILASKTVVGIRFNYSPQKFSIGEKDTSQIIVKYKEDFICNNDRNEIKHLSKCILNVDFLDSDSCFKCIQKVESQKSDDERILEKVNFGVALKEIRYLNIDEIQIGDIVKYTSLYGDIVYGIVIEKVKKTKPTIKFYSRPGKEVFEDVFYKKLTKITLLE